MIINQDFLHSYYFQESNKSQILATSNYGGIYTSCVFKDNIYGVQFHPEKSHQWGIQLLKNFSEIKECWDLDWHHVCLLEIMA